MAIINKGKSGKTKVTLSAPTTAALADWVGARGEWPGPLFVRLDRAAKALGLRAELAQGTNPHGLRHQGITQALDMDG
jgi:integrase